MIRFSCERGRQTDVTDDPPDKEVRCPICGTCAAGHGSSAISAEPIAPGTGNGKATASLLLGVVALCFLGNTLAEGFIGPRVMLWLASILCLGSILAALPGLLLGLGVLVLSDLRKGWTADGLPTAVVGLILSLLGLALAYPITAQARERSSLVLARANLERLVLGTRDHAQMNLDPVEFKKATHLLPSAAILSKEGKPLLSWRVALLPFIGEEALHRRFKLDEPWDSPHNIELLPLMPKIYALPGWEESSKGVTYFQVFVGPRTRFRDPARPPSLVDIPDGTSNTFLIAEAANPVPWTRPEDLNFDPNAPLPPLGGHFRVGFLVAKADGAVRMVGRNSYQGSIKLAIMPDDGTPLTGQRDWD
jgi:hypothetical protein